MAAAGGGGGGGSGSGKLPKVAVLGAGNIGCWVGGHLAAAAAADVKFLHRSSPTGANATADTAILLPPHPHPAAPLLCTGRAM